MCFRLLGRRVLISLQNHNPSPCRRTIPLNSLHLTLSLTTSMRSDTLNTMDFERSGSLQVLCGRQMRQSQRIHLRPSPRPSDKRPRPPSSNIRSLRTVNHTYLKLSNGLQALPEMYLQIWFRMPLPTRLCSYGRIHRLTPRAQRSELEERWFKALLILFPEGVCQARAVRLQP